MRVSILLSKILTTSARVAIWWLSNDNVVVGVGVVIVVVGYCSCCRGCGCCCSSSSSSSSSSKSSISCCRCFSRCCYSRFRSCSSVSSFSTPCTILLWRLKSLTAIWVEATFAATRESLSLASDVHTIKPFAVWLIDWVTGFLKYLL